MAKCLDIIVCVVAAALVLVSCGMFYRTKYSTSMGEKNALQGLKLSSVLEEYSIKTIGKYSDANDTQILYNPLIGYAPGAESHTAVGSNTLVYIDAYWRELEPQKGEYAFEKFYADNHIEEYKAEGKKAVFRLVCDCPTQSGHMDIPDWLYEETQDGSFYDTSYGKGYSPDYSNPVFIEAHGRLLNAIAEEFGGDNFFAYIEIGSLGHWGEWHVKYDDGLVRMPTEAVCMEYVNQYVDAFPNTRLLMRRPFKGVKEYGLGVYNDMVGEPKSTQEWLDWLNNGGKYTEPADTHTLYAVPDLYKTAPVGGEFTSRLSWGEMLGDKLDRTKELIQKSHMTFIGPKSPHINSAEEFQEQADEVRQLLGYKIGIESAETGYYDLTNSWFFDVTLNNKGVAPISYDWDCCLYFYGNDGDVLQRTRLPINITQLMPDESMSVRTLVIPDAEPEDIASVTIGIEDPYTGQPAVHLNNSNKAVKDGLEIVIYQS